MVPLLTMWKQSVMIVAVALGLVAAWNVTAMSQEGPFTVRNEAPSFQSENEDLVVVNYGPIAGEIPGLHESPIHGPTRYEGQFLEIFAMSGPTHPDKVQRCCRRAELIAIESCDSTSTSNSPICNSTISNSPALILRLRMPSIDYLECNRMSSQRIDRLRFIALGREPAE